MASLSSSLCQALQTARVSQRCCLKSTTQISALPIGSLRGRSERRASFVVKAEVTPSGGLKRTEDLEEKFAVLDSGKFGCNSCGYVYDQDKGDPSYPVPSGMAFKELPEDWVCPTCGASQKTFKSMGREVAGFVQNQQYGLGTNSMTGSQKSLLIWGSLGAFFMLFMSGYFLD